ncbi:pentapeptide repeats containing protein [Bacteriophage sp.]|nr:pentapeptide repeats containing protein [Caudoviricetes sp.]UOF79977.1 pentapeptide repeats containing protein [Bacteriophage sp.]
MLVTHHVHQHRERNQQMNIINRFSGLVIYEGASGMTQRAVLEAAVASRADLYGADLSGANLSRANLSGANLSRANLSGVNLSGVNLSGANLSGADLSRANLYGADLSGADLSGVNLSGVNLYGADLSRADLSRADLSGADLYGADLSGADLSGVKWTAKIVINKRPLQLSGLHWPVTILDAHMQIGCQLHSLHDWEEFDDAAIVAMGGREALHFWRAHKDSLLALARGAERSFDKVGG